MALNRKKQVTSEALLRYEICKAMGWDYYTFDRQPPFFIEEIRLIMNQEAQVNQSEINQIK